MIANKLGTMLGLLLLLANRSFYWFFDPFELKTRCSKIYK